MDPLVFNELETVVEGGEIQKGHVSDGGHGLVKKRVRREERQQFRGHVVDGQRPEELKERGACRGGGDGQ
jgi:hypothetical protein